MQGTPAFRRKSSNPSFFSPTRRLVFRSITTSETISGMGKISFPLKYSAYLPTRSFSYSSGSLCWTFHGDVTWLGGFVPYLSLIGLSDSEGSGKDGQFDPMRLVFWVSDSPHSSGCFGRVSSLFLPASPE